MRRAPTGVGYVGLGAYVPSQVRTNDFWPDEWRRRHQARLEQDIGGAVDTAVQRQVADVDPEVARHASRFHHDVFRGTRERRVMAPGEMPSDMEVAAARRALEHAGVSPDEIDLLIVYSSVPDLAGPHNQGLVAHRLGLPKRLIAFDIEAGCATFLPATTLATRMIQSGEVSTALIVISTPGSWVVDYDTPSSVIPGDGSVAAVVRRTDPELGFVAQTTLWDGAQHKGIVFGPQGAPLSPWIAGGKRLTVQHVDMEALHIAGAHAASLCREVCHQLLDEAGYTIDDVDFMVMANSTAWFPAALSEAIGLPEHKVLPYTEHFQRFGHLFAGSVPLNLYLSHQLGRLRRGDLVLIYSPGIGFTQSAVLVRWGLQSPLPALQ